MMNPFSTGAEIIDATKPSRSRPAVSATAPADRAADADIGETTRCRELPSTAYSTSAGTAAYSPTTGGTPAIVA